jgi:hypothetical protein
VQDHLTETALAALFHGKSNVPNSAQYCGRSTDEMKQLFAIYIKNNPVQDWELDTVPSWPYL